MERAHGWDPEGTGPPLQFKNFLGLLTIMSLAASTVLGSREGRKEGGGWGEGRGRGRGREGWGEGRKCLF